MTSPEKSNSAVALVNGVLSDAGTGSPFLLNLGNVAYLNASITTVVTGSPATCTITLQGTTDGVNWTALATATSTTGGTAFAVGNIPFNALRVNVSNVSGGTNPTLAVQVVAYDGSSVNSIVGGGSAGVGTAQRVNLGTISPVAVQSAATTGNGNVVDFGAAVGTIMWQIVPAGTITGGAVAMEVSLDGATWFTPPTAVFGNYSGATLANPYVLVTSTNALFDIGTGNTAIRYARARISSNVTGTGASVTVNISGY